MSRSCRVPVINKTTLSIMYAYLGVRQNASHLLGHDNIRDIVKKLAQGLHSIHTNVIELVDEYLCGLFGDGSG